MDNNLIAIVEETKITEEDLEEVINKYPKDKREFFKKEKWRNRLIKEVIGNELLYYYSKELKIDESQEFKKEVERFSKELLIKIIMGKITAEINITEDDAKQYYNSNEDEFIDEEKVAVRHILVESLDKALVIKKDIENNIISFEDAAMKYSICPTCMQGGSIGSVGKGILYPEIDKVIFDIEINKLSEPVQTEMGFHVLLVEDKKERRKKSFDEVKDNLIKKMTQDKQRKKYDGCIEALKNKFNVYKIVKDDGYED